MDSCVAHLSFDNHIDDSKHNLVSNETGKVQFVPGLEGQAIRFGSETEQAFLQYVTESLKLDDGHDFSLHFWVRTTMPSHQRAIILSTKDFPDCSLTSQKAQGWTWGLFNGTWAWNMGSGKRRISYERTNGEFMPINDGRWHQLVMTHSASEGLIRLYFDGKNWVTYNVKDSAGFEFGNKNPLVLGWSGQVETHPPTQLPVFTRGAEQLQKLVDEFNGLGLPPVLDAEFTSLVNDPGRLFASKLNKLKEQSVNSDLLESLESADLKSIKDISKLLMKSPYTVHQNGYYREVARVFKLYRLVNGKVEIHEPTARKFAGLEVLARPSFDLDELRIWDRVVSPEEVQKSYSNYFAVAQSSSVANLKKLTACCWNIFHGGLHQSIEEHGWDSREAIIDMLKREQVDVVMMQETYSNGDYIAAELGFYFATTVDWDNMHQGSNISVLSRYPITAVLVPPNSSFMNVAAKVELSQTQDIWVMSNWYGMYNFEDVYAFHQSRFAETDSLPILFGGDFNAVPDVDGGDSLAYRMLTDAGFVDAFRSLNPNVRTHPGQTHRNERRIDQLYYKGSGLTNKATTVYSTWPSLFPSDHYLIKSVFELNYRTEKSP